MKKLHLDKSNNIKIVIYFFSFFILITSTLSFLYKSKFSDTYTNIYIKLFVNKNEVQNLVEQNGDLQNEVQNLKNIILEKGISESELNSGLIDNIKANEIRVSPFKKDLIYSEILLSQGSIGGVEVLSRVYVPGFKLIGLISEVNENSSKLKLYSANNFENEFILKLEDESKDNVILDTNASNSTTTIADDITAATVKNYSFTGIGDGAYGIKIKVPQNFLAKINEKVYTKEDTTNPVGEIVSITDLLSQKEKELQVKTYYNLVNYNSFYISK